MYKTRKWTSGWRWNNWYSGKQSLFDAKLDSKLSSWFLHVSTPLTKVTSESKNKRQIAVVYHYCNLSRFFWLRCYICLPRDFSFVRLLYYQSFEITNQSLHIDVIEKKLCITLNQNRLYLIWCWSQLTILSSFHQLKYLLMWFYVLHNACSNMSYTNFFLPYIMSLTVGE